jgi:hypothetical protein
MVVLPACTSEGGHTNVAVGSPSVSKSSASATSDAAVRSLWAEFFNSSTSSAKRQTLLQSGSAFKDVLAAQSTQGPISATVTAVHFTDSSHASVSFSLRVGAATRLPSVAGAAVLQGGHWLVSKSTMCVVLAASGQHEAACS